MNQLFRCPIPIFRPLVSHPWNKLPTTLAKCGLKLGQNYSCNNGNPVLGGP